MDRSGKTIVVAGATGHQGGASCRHLLADGWHVRAMTRHPDAPHARELADLGVELVHADLTDRASLDAALRGAYGVHSVETPREAGFEGEVTEGRNLVDAAVAAGVRHFTYDSVLGADRDHPTLGWIASKHELEAYLRDSGLPYTIWRPATFMENFLGQLDDIAAGVLTGTEPAGTVKQYITVDDIGRFVALGFGDPDTWMGQATEIAGDRCTLTDVADVFSGAVGRKVDYLTSSSPSTPSPEPRKTVDIDRLRAVMPGLQTLETWARAVDWSAVAEPAGRHRT